MIPRQSSLIAIAMVSSLAFLNSCNKDSAAVNAGTTSGKGGSVTRFTISENYLYAVSNHFLYAYSLSNPAKPEIVFTSPLEYDIETIYPYNKYLFLGTKTGLYVYSIDTASSPRLIGEARHARSCDPVVVNDSVAYVTLKSSPSCGPAVAGLYIHDIKNITEPILKATIELPDPFGLGLQDSVLYVCCGNEGLKVFNVKSPYMPVLLSTMTDGNYMDVIPYNGNLICSVADGIILYDITNPAAPVIIKKIGNKTTSFQNRIRG
jgi:hypothetical protein